MGHVPDRDSGLLLNIRKEGTLVVDKEVVDAVLVGKLESGRVGASILGDFGAAEVEAMER